MLQKIRKQTQGFTIIEVLIVLAIAGLILLIVFLAVPALQRNSRNTQYRNAAASVLGGVSEFTNNNNGQLPTNIAANATTGVVTISGGAGTTPAEAKIQGGFTAQLNVGAPANTGQFNIAANRKCNGNVVSGTTTNRAYAALFKIEAANSAVVDQCVES